MISVDHLPRDQHGIIQGAWRILHRDPAYHGGVGTVELRDGRSQEPVFGRRLVGIVAVFGTDLFLEPWGDLPPGTTLPPLVEPTVSDEMLARLERCPWRAEASPTGEGDEKSGDEGKPAPEPDDLDALDLAALQTLATELGFTPGNKQEKALRKLIRAARAEASPTGEG